MRLLLFSILAVFCAPAAAQVTPIFRPAAAPTWGVPRAAPPRGGDFRIVAPPLRPASAGPGAAVRVAAPPPPMGGAIPAPSYVGLGGAPVPTIGAPAGVPTPRCLPLDQEGLPWMAPGAGRPTPSVVIPAPPPGPPPPMNFGPGGPSWGAPPPSRTLNLSRALQRGALRPHSIASINQEGVGITVGAPLPPSMAGPTPVGVFPPAVGGPPPPPPTPNFVGPPSPITPAFTVPLPMAPAWLGQQPLQVQTVAPNSRALRIIRRQREQVAGVEFDLASSMASAAQQADFFSAANSNSERPWTTCPAGGGCEHLRSRAYQAGGVAGASTVCTAGASCQGRGGVAIDYWAGGRSGQIDGLPTGQTTANIARLRPGAQIGADAIVDHAAGRQNVVSPERLLGAYGEARGEVMMGAPTGNGLVLPTHMTPGPRIGPVR